LCQTFLAFDHWTFGSTKTFSSVTGSFTPKWAASDLRTCVQILSCSVEPTIRKPSSPKRIGAQLDWHAYWEADNYEERIKNTYKKRNALLHQGRRDEVTNQDLAFADHILVNVLRNLVSHPKLFSSKDAIVEFSEKVEAQRTLGVKRRGTVGHGLKGLEAATAYAPEPRTGAWWPEKKGECTVWYHRPPDPGQRIHRRLRSWAQGRETSVDRNEFAWVCGRT
jgi:hypothetical protein